MNAVPPVLDLEHLLRLRQLAAEDDLARLADLFQVYLHSVPLQIEHMQHLVARGEWAILSLEAHALAGSSAMYGMPRVRVHCKALEARAKDAVPEGTGEILAAVEKAFAEALPLLRAELALGI
jgi:HPt (histidine-containing phosphotransfer) domain-containing protein